MIIMTITCQLNVLRAVISSCSVWFSLHILPTK